jgi:Dolichyl-phosphate-mannose-protein mannosyltransferase
MDDLQSDHFSRISANRPAWRDWQWLLLLVALVIPLRGWLLVNTEVAARDSIGFIRYALRFEEQPWGEVVRSFDQHPGYPFAVWLVSMPIRTWAGVTSPEIMQLSAQLTSALAAVLLLVPMFYLGKAVWDVRIGFGASLLFQFLPVSAHHLTDGISESVYLLFVSWALVTAVWGLQTRRSRWFLVCGVSIGLAYLTRPEGALLLCAVGLTLLGLQAHPHWRQSWRTWLRNGACVTAAALLVGALYVWATGKFTTKHAIENLWTKPVILEPIEAAPCWPGLRAQLWADSFTQAHTFGQRLQLGIGALVGEITYSLHYFGCLPLLVALCWQGKAMLRRPEPWVLLIYVLLHVVVLVLLSVSAGYLSDRHVMPLVLVLCYLVAVGFVELATWALAWQQRWVSRLRDCQRLVPVTSLTMLAIFLACCLPLTLKRLHANRIGNHEAGQWLAQRVRPGDLVLDDHCWSHYYAGQVLLEHKVPPAPADYRPTCYVVMTRSQDPKVAAERKRWERWWKSSNAIIVHQWPATATVQQARVVIYALPRDPRTQPWTVAKN